MAFGLNRDFRSYCVGSQCCADFGGFTSKHGTHRSTRHEHFDAPTSHNFCIVASDKQETMGFWSQNHFTLIPRSHESMNAGRPTQRE